MEDPLFSTTGCALVVLRWNHSGHYFIRSSVPYVPQKSVYLGSPLGRKRPINFLNMNDPDFSNTKVKFCFALAEKTDFVRQLLLKKLCEPVSRSYMQAHKFVFRVLHFRQKFEQLIVMRGLC